MMTGPPQQQVMLPTAAQQQQQQSLVMGYFVPAPQTSGGQPQIYPPMLVNAQPTLMALSPGPLPQQLNPIENEYAEVDLRDTPDIMRKNESGSLPKPDIIQHNNNNHNKSVVDLPSYANDVDINGPTYMNETRFPRGASLPPMLCDDLMERMQNPAGNPAGNPRENPVAPPRSKRGSRLDLSKSAHSLFCDPDALTDGIRASLKASHPVHKSRGPPRRPPRRTDRFKKSGSFATLPRNFKSRNNSPPPSRCQSACFGSKPTVPMPVGGASGSGSAASLGSLIAGAPPVVPMPRGDSMDLTSLLEESSSSSSSPEAPSIPMPKSGAFDAEIIITPAKKKSIIKQPGEKAFTSPFENPERFIEMQPQVYADPASAPIILTSPEPKNLDPSLVLRSVIITPVEEEGSGGERKGESSDENEYEDVELGQRAVQSHAKEKPFIKQPSEKVFTSPVENPERFIDPKAMVFPDPGSMPKIIASLERETPELNLGSRSISITAAKEESSASNTRVEIPLENEYEDVELKIPTEQVTKAVLKIDVAEAKVDLVKNEYDLEESELPLFVAEKNKKERESSYDDVEVPVKEEMTPNVDDADIKVTETKVSLEDEARHKMKENILFADDTIEVPKVNEEEQKNVEHENPSKKNRESSYDDVELPKESEEIHGDEKVQNDDTTDEFDKLEESNFSVKEAQMSENILFAKDPHEDVELQQLQEEKDEEQQQENGEVVNRPKEKESSYDEVDVKNDEEKVNSDSDYEDVANNRNDTLKPPSPSSKGSSSSNSITTTRNQILDGIREMDSTIECLKIGMIKVYEDVYAKSVTYAIPNKRAKDGEKVEVEHITIKPQLQEQQPKQQEEQQQQQHCNENDDEPNLRDQINKDFRQSFFGLHELNDEDLIENEDILVVCETMSQSYAEVDDDAENGDQLEISDDESELETYDWEAMLDTERARYIPKDILFQVSNIFTCSGRVVVFFVLVGESSKKPDTALLPRLI